MQDENVDEVLKKNNISKDEITDSDYQELKEEIDE
jgi:hypothetical protein